MKLFILTLFLAFTFSIEAQTVVDGQGVASSTQRTDRQDRTISAGNLARLKAIAEQNEKRTDDQRIKVAVAGTVYGFRLSPNGRSIRLFFKEAEEHSPVGFYCVYFPRDNFFQDMENAFGGHYGSGLLGKEIHIHGAVTLYQQRPQIIITSTDQIIIIENEEESSPPESP